MNHMQRLAIRARMRDTTTKEGKTGWAPAGAVRHAKSDMRHQMQYLSVCKQGFATALGLLH